MIMDILRGASKGFQREAKDVRAFVRFQDEPQAGDIVNGVRMLNVHTRFVGEEDPAMVQHRVAGHRSVGEVN
jgi:hypothetical protein